MEPNEPIEPMEQTQPTQPQEPSSMAPQKQSKSKMPMLLGVLLILALAGCGVLAWMLNDQANQKSSVQNQLSSKNSQITTLKAELKTANAAVKENADSSNQTTTDTSSTASDDMVKMALAYAKAKVADTGYPQGATDLQGTIDKQTATFARVQVGSSTAGPGVDVIYFKKVGSDWVLLGDDNGNPTRFHTAFGMPSGF